MGLFDLIHKPKSTPIATLTVATQSTEPPVTVAKAASVTVANPAESKIDNADDPHHCRECRHLSSTGYCIQQRFRPVDDIPRRCYDFNGYPDRIGQISKYSVLDGRAKETEKKQLIVEAARVTTAKETAHNAQGRFFKFLITRPDGSQFYSCTMPRIAIEEVRTQYPDAANIEPVENEDYGDEG
jgi:hypothetical protein